jgi:hypothetical protein
MRRTFWIASLMGGLGLAALFFFQTSPSPAEPGKAQEATTAVPKLPRALSLPLPIQQVILFSSGVGYFQREGLVEGATRIDLAFPVQDINDLLKSMILQDLDGGQISAVSYDSQDPLDKTLQSFAVKLTNNPTFGQILNQARGEKVEVVMQPTAPNGTGTLEGAIVGIERQPGPSGKEGAEVDMLNLWCADGMRSIRLADVQRIKFLSPVIDDEVKRALQVLASSHDSQKKAVSLNFTGEGKRRVRVGYVVENPIWKTSYRLVLSKNGQAFLQGWAVVENPTDEDWTNVRLTLVSGRPISYQMDLYQPLYVPRPVVEPELFASLRPQAYSGGMGGVGIGGGAGGPALGTPPIPTAKPTPISESTPDRNKAKTPPPEPKASKPSLGAGAAVGAAVDEAPSGNPNAGVLSAALTADLGSSFEYLIEKPVSLPRRKSALFPIANQNVTSERVSIYNASVHEKFPLLGLKFKNTTGLHLMQGPVTVFDGNSYAGDARLMDLQPKEERLLSYAIDLGTEVETIVPKPSDHLIKVKIQKGILFFTVKGSEGVTYQAKNRSDHDRTLIIEHPYRPNFRLVSQTKPADRTRDSYRFEVKVPAGKTARLEVVEEQEVVNKVQLTTSDEKTIGLYLNNRVSSPRVKEALAKAVQLKSRLAMTQRELAQLEQQLKTITEDQGRLRANLKEMPPTAVAYKRYLEKFDSQETEIEKLQAQIKKLREAENQECNEYETFLSNLDVE